MVRISAIDAMIWACQIKKRGIVQFEYKDLPEELKDKALLYRAKGEGLITSLGKNGSGRHLWRISDNIKCRIEKDDVSIENKDVGTIENY